MFGTATRNLRRAALATVVVATTVGAAIPTASADVGTVGTIRAHTFVTCSNSQMYVRAPALAPVGVPGITLLPGGGAILGIGDISQEVAYRVHFSRYLGPGSWAAPVTGPWIRWETDTSGITGSYEVLQADGWHATSSPDTVFTPSVLGYYTVSADYYWYPTSYASEGSASYWINSPGYYAVQGGTATIPYCAF
jgi:hypothetical protein